MKINPFDWEIEFTEIMKNGGFDCVIGNPPYGAEIPSNEDSYLREKFSTASYQIDTYSLFIEKAHVLVNKNGKVGYIIPTAWVASQYNEPLRKLLTFPCGNFIHRCRSKKNI